VANFTDVLGDFRGRLRTRGFDVRDTAARVTFTAPICDTPILALPDVHLCAGDGGDIFLQGDNGRASKLEAVMGAIGDYLDTHPLSSYALQLGDWFDIWRVCGSDPANVDYGDIQNASVYQNILALDARIGLAHLIGNHDAAFLRSLPDRRAGQPDFFRLGFWVGRNVYAMHGHQTDLAPPAGSSWDQLAVHLATLVGAIAPRVTTLEQYIDRLGDGPGVTTWLRDSLLGIREDPPAQHRPPDNGRPPANIRSGQFVVRENVDAFASIVDKVAALPQSQGRAADVVIVGHSHAPCVAWTEITGRPIIVVDAGCWVYGQANLLIMAGDTVAVFDVV
jgi:UDP-2,3-diacylglucosamine pyrophosphatase LpxH